MTALRNVVAKDITTSTVWSDRAYRSKTKEKRVNDNGLKSDIQ